MNEPRPEGMPDFEAQIIRHDLLIEKCIAAAKRAPSTQRETFAVQESRRQLLAVMQGLWEEAMTQRNRAERLAQIVTNLTGELEEQP